MSTNFLSWSDARGPSWTSGCRNNRWWSLWRNWWRWGDRWSVRRRRIQSDRIVRSVTSPGSAWTWQVSDTSRTPWQRRLTWEWCHPHVGCSRLPSSTSVSGAWLASCCSPSEPPSVYNWGRPGRREEWGTSRGNKINCNTRFGRWRSSWVTFHKSWVPMILWRCSIPGRLRIRRIWAGWREWRTGRRWRCGYGRWRRSRGRSPGTVGTQPRIGWRWRGWSGRWCPSRSGVPGGRCTSPCTATTSPPTIFPKRTCAPTGPLSVSALSTGINYQRSREKRGWGEWLHSTCPSRDRRRIPCFLADRRCRGDPSRLPRSWNRNKDIRTKMNSCRFP